MDTTFSKDDFSVFISYARKDGYDFASRLFRDLETTKCQAWLDKEYLQPGVNWAADIEKAIDSSNHLVAVLTQAYFDSEICRAEHMRALRKGKIVIPLLLQRDADRPLALEHLNYQDFTTPQRYAESFGALRAAIEGGRSGATLPTKFQSTFVNAPPLPAGYVARGEELEQLRVAVIRDSNSREVGLTSLAGMGGIGKTVLSIALCNDELIQAAFPDGIIWVSVGRTPGNLVPQMRSIGLVFGDRPEYYETTETSAARLRQVLRGRAAMLVIDDVWERQHLEPFLTGEPRSRVLFTSRDRTIALGLGAREVRLGRLKLEEAVCILTEWAGYSDDSFREIAKCGAYLPLALKLAGASLRAGMKPVDWLQRYRSQPLQNKLGYRAHSDKEDLAACFDLSLERYETRERDLYYALGIFPEDIRIPWEVVWRLWSRMEIQMKQDRLRELLGDLARMELLDIDEAGAIGLHDLMQEYAQNKLGDKQIARHADLLDSYVHGRARYWDVQDDGYFFRYVAHHLVGARRTDLLQTMLVDFRWIQAKLGATDPAALIEDYDAVPGSRDHKLIATAIRLSSHVLTRDRDQVASQLTGRLLGDKSATIRRLLSAARKTRHAWLRPLGNSLRSAGGALVRTLVGHEAGVSDVLFTPDENAAISCSFDGTIKIWDWRKGNEMRTIAGHARQINSIAITPDGRRLVSGSSDGKVKVWDLASGNLTDTLQVDNSAIVSVETDENILKVTSLRGSVDLWDLRTRKVIDRAQVEEQETMIASAVSGDGKSVLKATTSGGLELRDRRTDSLIRKLSGHPSYVYAVAVTSDMRNAISAHDDCALRVWNLEREEEGKEVKGQQRPLLLAPLPWLSRVASSCADRSLRIWNPRSGTAVRSLLHVPRPMVSLRSSLSGLSLVGVTWNLRFYVAAQLLGVPLPDPRSVWTWLFPYRHQVSNLQMASVAATSFSSSRIIFSTREPTWSRLNLWTRSIRKSEGGHRTRITALAVSFNGCYVASGSEDGIVILWNSRSRAELMRIEAHEGATSGVAISWNGSRIASSGLDDRTVRVWDAKDGRQIASFTADYDLQSCAISRLGHVVFAADVTGQIHRLRINGRG